MIQLTAASIRYGEKVLFEDLDWLITPQARIGIVGANGSGKTTLVKVIQGLLFAAGRSLAFRAHGFRRMHGGIRRGPGFGE